MSGFPTNPYAYLLWVSNANVSVSPSSAASLAAAMQAIPNPPVRFRPKPIDPKVKLSDKAALLLSLNHLLRSAA